MKKLENDAPPQELVKYILFGSLGTTTAIHLSSSKIVNQNIELPDFSTKLQTGTLAFSTSDPLL